uniref:Sperm flagellar 2 n=1 Tax=Anolis carolinensis TaxID=28377 RepID=H9GEH4_ANOCA
PFLLSFHWPAKRVLVSQVFRNRSFSREFSSGYLIGELLNKFELQEDFDQFSQSRVASAKLNNFSRMEPTLQLLKVQFDQNVARNIMTEQHGAATKLIYQLYVALEKKKKAGLTGVAMDAMRPSAHAKLRSVGTEMYRERLKSLVPRQTELTLLQISDSFHKKADNLESKIYYMELANQEKAKKIQGRKAEDMEKKILEKQKQNEIMAKIQAAIVQIPKPMPQHTVKAIEEQKMLRKKKEAEVKIMKFEKMMRKETIIPTNMIQGRDVATPTITELLSTYSDDEYIRKVQKRLEEDTFAREQREKRRRKMLREQLIAHEAQEEAYREEQLINRLMRQSQQERRIAVQLLHVKHEKEVMWQDRIFREKQFEERRLKEFQEALDREAALAKQEKIEFEEQAHKEKQLHAKLAAQRAEERYKKHFAICWEVVDQIIDLVTKIGEYRTLTNNLIPIKIMRDWKELFLKGKPIYEQAELDPLPADPTPDQIIEFEKMDILDEKDYDEYKIMIEEWYPPEEIRANKPPPSNIILGHVVHRLMGLFYPPEPEPPPPVSSPFPIKGCILGKLFSGKTTCLKFLEEACNIHVLSIDTLIAEAIQAYHEKEMSSETSLLQVSKLDIPSMDQIAFSIRAQLGGGAETLLKKGKSIPDELLVGIMVEAISRLPPEKGWILDGFPMTLNQAKLLEKALGGRDPDEEEVNAKVLKKHNLVIDPAAPKEPAVHPPGLDFVILLDVSDSIVLDRIAFGSEQERGDQVSDAELQRREKADSVRGQMQHRLVRFLETWPDLKTWYANQQNILIKVNAEMEENLMCQRVKQIIMEQLVKIENERTPRGKAQKSLSPSPEDVLPPAPIEPPPIKPGSNEWVPEFLVPYWETVEKTYVNNIKATLRCLRAEQHVIIYYLSDIRNHFKEYLKRPDHKQEFVTQWQADYNSVADDLWDDDETKEELHQRVTDLRDRLWDICENRRNEAEQERCAIMNDGWLPDRMVLLMDHIFSLMQNELDRFQDTKRLLHDYYRGMEGKIPTDSSTEFIRIPLIELVEKEQLLEAGKTMEAAKSRLELLKVKALAFMEDLHSKAEVTYRNMEKWLGERFLIEMSSVEKLTEVARNHIETSTRMQYELVLEGTEFYINGDIKVFPDAVPPPRPPSVETPTVDTLTISQLSTLHKQFLKVAPKGLMLSKTFTDIFFDLVTLNLGSNSLPDAWTHLSIYDLQSLASLLTVDVDTVDWRRFLLAAAQPWPLPSVKELLETLQRFRAVDEGRTGFVTEEEYNQAGLWFGSGSVIIPDSPIEPLPFNRQEHLLKFFFTLFADPEKDPPQLNYVDMLLYFASHPESIDGVYRALSVATETNIQREKDKFPNIPRVEEEGGEEGEEEEDEKEKEDEAHSFASEGEISLDTLLRVFNYETNKAADNHRFTNHLVPKDNYENFIKVYKDLGSEDLQPIKVSLLLKHPFIQELVNSCQVYKLHVSIPFHGVWRLVIIRKYRML